MTLNLKLLGVAVAVIGLGVAGTAAAADRPVSMPAKAPPAPVVVYTWTGCYIGGNVGAAWEHTDVRDEIAGYPIASLSATSVIGGGQVGCDYQFASNWVIGVQGMLDATGLKADTTSVPLGPLTLHGKIPWVATVTGRIGYAPNPRLLIYAKGGGAWTHTDSSLFVTGVGTVIDSVGFSQSGWTAGGGAEWMLARNWSMFAEYNYLGFTDKTVYFPNTTNIGTVRQHVQAALIGFNFRFNGLLR
jgi:outer membrane immunogenic protein